ncbi:MULTISPECIES: hypothetical protein [unclassified Okeania]|nr:MULTISPECIES: hypothetical protein [unclassified Okeania]
MFFHVTKIPNSLGAEMTEGVELFQIHCVGCHANGGNIVRWEKISK